MKQIALGCIQYNQDYDGRYPLLASGGAGGVSSAAGYSPFGWASATQPYLKSTQILQCPTEITDPSAGGADNITGYTDYYLNGLLNHAKESKLVSPTTTIFLGDGGNSISSDKTDAQYSSDGMHHPD